MIARALLEGNRSEGLLTDTIWSWACRACGEESGLTWSFGPYSYRWDDTARRAASHLRTEHGVLAVKELTRSHVGRLIDLDNGSKLPYGKVTMRLTDVEHWHTGVTVLHGIDRNTGKFVNVLRPGNWSCAVVPEP